MNNQKSTAKIGLWTTTSLVVGNMIGSGVFLLPASLAFFGGISLIGWVGSSLGAIFLAVLFSRLSKIVPNSVGGPYAYTREGLGDFAAFLVAWGYWISLWCTNAAIAVTFVSYMSVFIPILKTDSFAALGMGLGAVWLLTWLNTTSVKETGRLQLITTILKLMPLTLIAFVGIFYMKMENFSPFNVSPQSNLSAIATTVTLTLFSFLGLESATIPSGNIENPEKTIPRATMIGTLIAISVYILGSAAVMGMIPSSELKNSHAPFSDAAAIIWGDSARYWVAIGAIVSTFGALNGWILLQGQIPLAASRDNMFPRIFRKENKAGMPVTSLVASSILISGLLLMNLVKSLTDTFTFLVLLTTVCVLVTYLFSAASYGVLLLKSKSWRKDHWAGVIIALVAFSYSLFAVVGSSMETVYWGFIAILSGIPFYVWMRRGGQENVIQSQFDRNDSDQIS